MVDVSIDAPGAGGIPPEALPDTGVPAVPAGPGVPPEYHLEIFDDFFRLPSSEKAEGMGLGLAIARRLVNGMGGKVWVESEPGAGCKFSFILPLLPPTTDSEGKANGR